MKNYRSIITILIMMFLASACSKKTHPAESSSNASNNSGTAAHATVKKIRTVVPKVIVVNDSAATKTFDGRYYYDLQGHRYWRNNVDGKYYLYNISMNTDPAFKKQ